MSKDMSYRALYTRFVDKVEADVDVADDVVIPV